MTPSIYQVVRGKKLYLRISYNGQAATDLSTRLSTEEYDKEKKCFLSPQKQEALNLIIADIMDSFNMLKRQKKPITAHLIKNSIQISKGVTFVDLLKDYSLFLDKKAQNEQMRAVSSRKYKYQLKGILEWLKKTKQDSLKVHEIDIFFAHRYENWLQNRADMNPLTIKRYTQLLTRLMDFAIQSGILENHNILRRVFTVKGTHKTKPLVFLSPLEIARLEQWKFETKIYEQVKDLFLFSCYTGLAFSDVQNFDYAKHVVQENGTLFISLDRQKTGTLSLLPLFSNALEVLKKYKFKLPKFRNDHFNRYLKELSKLVSINKPMSSHVARKTAGYFWLNSGISIEVVARMLGHTNTLITQNLYAKVLTTRILAETQHLHTIKKPVSESLQAWKQA